MQILNLNMEIWLNSSPIIGELGNCGALKVSGEGPEVIQALQGGLHESAKIRSQKHWSQQSLESKAVRSLPLRTPKGRPHRSCANWARPLAALARD